jgi:hypothetical protein
MILPQQRVNTEAMSSSGVRLHGFERPFSSHQVGSWVVFAILVTAQAVLYSAVHVDRVGIPLTCLYATLTLAVFATNMSCTGFDPSDVGARDKRRANAAGALPPAPGPDAVNYCYLCEAHVKKRSKHCRQCNKCVDTFDHHCPWLNTCVGARNYRGFFCMLLSVFALTVLQIATTAHAGARLLSTDADVIGPYRMPRLAYGLLLIATFVLVLLPFLLIVQLLTFHVALTKVGITTYEFIVKQRKKEAALEEASGDAPPTWAQARRAWVNRNAPCLAVCELLDEVEGSREVSSTRGGGAVPCSAALRAQMRSRRTKTVKATYETPTLSVVPGQATEGTAASTDDETAAAAAEERLAPPPSPPPQTSPPLGTPLSLPVVSLGEAAAGPEEAESTIHGELHGVAEPNRAEDENGSVDEAHNMLDKPRNASEVVIEAQ